MTSNSQYNDLTEFLLGPLRKKPGMFLKEPTISNLSIFITGYLICDQIKNASSGSAPDKFWGDNDFYNWYIKKYQLQKSSHWHTYFLEQTMNDEWKALQLFFEKLEEFAKETT